MNKELIVIVTSSAEGDFVTTNPELANSSGRIVKFVRKGDSVCKPHKELEQIVEIIEFNDLSDFYNSLNRILYPLLQVNTWILFTSTIYTFNTTDLESLQATIEADPLYGFALPRTNYGGSSPIPRGQEETSITEPAQYHNFLKILPVRRGGGIVQGPPVLVKTSVLYHFGRLEGNTFDMSDALAALYTKANRRGYSAVVSNHSLFLVLEQDKLPVLAVQPPQLERASDYYKALPRYAEYPEQRAEKLLWNLMRPKALRKVLFDIRNLAPGYNGTAQYILSLLQPLCKLAGEFNIEPCFWVLASAAEFHLLDKKFSGRFVYEMNNNEIFDAAMRLSQPWSFSELKDQAHRAPLNSYVMMDTIAWDCNYIRMPHIDGVWRTTSAYSDGLMFLSEYAKRVFHERFPRSKDVPYAISYCSLDPHEYHEESKEIDCVESKEPPYILVVGNRYYHKGLHETVHVIATGFPETKIKVLGEIADTYPNVEMFTSGMIESDAVDDLFRRCVCLVFPSFYEGFGLPILKALSFGKPVIARHSELVDEIREKIKPINGIISFERKTQLLRAISGVLNKKEFRSEQRLNNTLVERSFGWEHSAQTILELADKLMKHPDYERCLERLEFFYRFDQLDIERAGWTNTDQNKIIFEAELEE